MLVWPWSLSTGISSRSTLCWEGQISVSSKQSTIRWINKRDAFLFATGSVWGAVCLKIHPNTCAHDTKMRGNCRGISRWCSLLRSWWPSAGPLLSPPTTTNVPFWGKSREGNRRLQAGAHSKNISTVLSGRMWLLLRDCSLKTFQICNSYIMPSAQILFFTCIQFNLLWQAHLPVFALIRQSSVVITKRHCCVLDAGLMKSSTCAWGNMFPSSRMRTHPGLTCSCKHTCRHTCQVWITHGGPGQESMSSSVASRTFPYLISTSPILSLSFHLPYLPLPVSPSSSLTRPISSSIVLCVRVCLCLCHC